MHQWEYLKIEEKLPLPLFGESHTVQSLSYENLSYSRAHFGSFTCESTNYLGCEALSLKMGFFVLFFVLGGG